MDGAPRDAAPLDASPSDAGTADAGEVDAGPPVLATEGCVTSVAAGHHVFRCDGIAYDVELSGACARGGCGLIVDVHGATMNADVQDRNTGLRRLGAERGYVVVQPTAPASAAGPSWDPARDDPRVLSFVRLALRALAIDPDRVHMTGFSQGGYMTWRMLCQHADLFASVAPAAAASGTLFDACPFSATARPAREVPVLYMHGREDRIVAWSFAPPQRDAVVAGWSMAPDGVVSMDAQHLWSRWRSPSGTVFEFVEHRYEAYSRVLAGHCIPGSPDVGSSPFGTTGYGCVGPSAFDWGERVVAFFEAHPRRP